MPVLRLRDDHAFAHYYLSKAYTNLDNSELSNSHRLRYFELIKQKFWGRWAALFNLEGAAENFLMANEFPLFNNLELNLEA